jgi:hypothetical protein
MSVGGFYVVRSRRQCYTRGKLSNVKPGRTSLPERSNICKYSSTQVLKYAGNCLYELIICTDIINIRHVAQLCHLVICTDENLFQIRNRK